MINIKALLFSLNIIVGLMFSILVYGSDISVKISYEFNNIEIDEKYELEKFSGNIISNLLENKVPDGLVSDVVYVNGVANTPEEFYASIDRKDGAYNYFLEQSAKDCGDLKVKSVSILYLINKYKAVKIVITKHPGGDYSIVFVHGLKEKQVVECAYVVLPMMVKRVANNLYLSSIEY